MGEEPAALGRGLGSGRADVSGMAGLQALTASAPWGGSVGRAAARSGHKMSLALLGVSSAWLLAASAAAPSSYAQSPSVPLKVTACGAGGPSLCRVSPCEPQGPLGVPDTWRGGRGERPEQQGVLPRTQGAGDTGVCTGCGRGGGGRRRSGGLCTLAGEFRHRCLPRGLPAFRELEQSEGLRGLGGLSPSHQRVASWWPSSPCASPPLNTTTPQSGF